MNNYRKKKYTVVGLLFILWLFHSFNNYYILEQDISPLIWDPIGFYLYTIQLFKQHILTSPFGFTYYPTLYNYTTLPLFQLFGISPDIAAMTNSLYLLILILSVYGIVNQISQNKLSALFAACIVTFIPSIFGFSRIYRLTFPLTAMTCLSIYFLIKTQNFTKRLFCLLCGASIGLSMLTKWSFPVYFGGPFLFYTIRSYRFLTQTADVSQLKKTKKAFWFNILFILAAAFLISSGWYTTSFWPVLIEKGLIAFTPSFISPALLRYNNNIILENILTLFYCLNNYGLYFLLFIVFSSCLLYFLFSDNNLKNLFLSWIFLPAILFLIAPLPFGSGMKSTRFLVPMLPSFGIITALVISKINSGLLKKSLIGLILFLSLLQFILLSYFPEIYCRISPLNYFSKEKKEHYYWEHRVEEGLITPYIKDWKEQEVLRAIEDTQHQRKRSLIIITQNIPPLSTFLHFAQYLYGFNINFDNPIEILNSGSSSSYDYETILKKTDYIIDFEGTKKYIITPITAHLKKDYNTFQLTKKIEAPENITILIYKKQD